MSVRSFKLSKLGAQQGRVFVEVYGPIINIAFTYNKIILCKIYANKIIFLHNGYLTALTRDLFNRVLKLSNYPGRFYLKKNRLYYCNKDIRYSISSSHWVNNS